MFRERIARVNSGGEYETEFPDYICCHYPSNCGRDSSAYRPGKVTLIATTDTSHPVQTVDLGTFGGPQSYVNIPDLWYGRVLNNRGVVAGLADTSTPDPFPDFCWVEDCFVAHAFRSKNGAKQDLGVFPGGASSEANWITDNGLIAGDSQNGETDPLIPGFPQMHAVLWEHGEMIDLGTLDGGYESFASSVNSRGQVVGLALNGIPDPDSMFGLLRPDSIGVGRGYQARAYLWQNGSMQDLGTLGGPDAWAFVVNERGQVAGNSYTSTAPSERCAQFGIGFLTTGAFLWEKGTMKDLGNFGGTCTFAFDLNNRGEVVGGSALAGDQGQHPFLWDGKELTDLHTFGGDNGNAVAINEAGDAVGWTTYPDQTAHAALWRHGKEIKDLGILTDYPLTFANDINASGQIVGFAFSSDFSKVTGFLWENGGPMVDLNSLIPPGSDLQVFFPETINDRGEIAGDGFAADGAVHAFLLIPCGEDCGNADGGENASRHVNAAQPGPARITTTQPDPTPKAMPAGLGAKLPRRYLVSGFRTAK